MNQTSAEILFDYNEFIFLLGLFLGVIIGILGNLIVTWFYDVNRNQWWMDSVVGAAGGILVALVAFVIWDIRKIVLRFRKIQKAPTEAKAK